MKALLIGATALTLLIVTPQLAQADLADQLVGVWKGTGFAHKVLETGELRKPWGDKPSGVATFSRGGYLTYQFLAEARKVPQAPPTDEDRALLYNTMAFGSGPYRVEGDKVFMKYDNSWNQTWTGTERVQTMHINGKVLTWTSAPLKAPDGKEVVAVFTYERLE